MGMEIRRNKKFIPSSVLRTELSVPSSPYVLRRRPLFLHTSHKNKPKREAHPLFLYLELQRRTPQTCFLPALYSVQDEKPPPVGEEREKHRKSDKPRVSICWSAASSLPSSTCLLLSRCSIAAANQQTPPFPISPTQSNPAHTPHHTTTPIYPIPSHHLHIHTSLSSPSLPLSCTLPVSSHPPTQSLFSDSVHACTEYSLGFLHLSFLLFLFFTVLPYLSHKYRTTIQQLATAEHQLRALLSATACVIRLAGM